MAVNFENPNLPKVNIVPRLSRLLKTNYAIQYSTLLSLILLFIELIYSQITNSLLLFTVALVQLSLTAFLLFTVFIRNGENIKSRLVNTLLNCLVLVLLTGIIFFECYERYTTPIDIHSNAALLVALFAFMGNLLIIRMLWRTNFLKLKFGSFRLPLQGIGILSITVLLGTALITLTDYYLLDVLFSLLVGISIFIRAGFMMIDAYWHIHEMA
ncbi:MAG: hypothetical protein AAFO07_05330 [Bacteroidota bacterium]